LLALGLFREPVFAVACFAGFFAGAAMFGAIIHVTLLLQWGRGLDATTAGLSLITMSGGWSLGGVVAGQLLNRVGFWRMATFGLLIMTAGYAALAARPDAPFTYLTPVGGTIGIGMGLSTVTLIVAVQTLIRRELRGIATSSVLFFRNIGATLGVAVMGAVLTSRLGVELGGLDRGSGALTPRLAAELVDAIGVVFWLGTTAALFGLVATWFLPDGSPASAAALRGPEELPG